MSTYTITTNRIPRTLFAYYELPDAVREQFDYLTEDEYHNPQFFQYRGEWYDFHGFERTSGELDHLGWHGQLAQSYWDGLAVKYVEDAFGDDSIVVAHISW